MKFFLFSLVATILSTSALAQNSVKGFADLHNQMLAEYSFGGVWFHRNHTGEKHHAMADCDGSTKSFAQAYEYGISKGIPTAFGSDFNGFIQQLRPRFGGEKKAAVPLVIRKQDVLNKKFKVIVFIKVLIKVVLDTSARLETLLLNFRTLVLILQ